MTAAIVSPALDAATRRQCTGVRRAPARGNRAHAARQSIHVDRRGTRRRRIVAELAVLVAAPTFDPAGGRQRTGVKLTRCNCLQAAGQTVHVHRCVADPP